MDILYFVSSPGDNSIVCTALFIIQGPNRFKQELVRNFVGLN